MKASLLLVSLMLLSLNANADVYKWVDSKGQVHYGDQPKGDRQEKISIDSSPVEKTDSPAEQQRKTDKLLKDMEKSRKQREKLLHKKRMAQRKQDEKCLKQRNAIRKLEAKMQKHYSEFSNDRPPSYQRQEAELADRKKFVDKYCN
jgi:hypothetical protein